MNRNNLTVLIIAINDDKIYHIEVMIMKNVEIYTDGACSGNPGKGGWAAVLVYKGTEKEISGGEKETTNNRMELTAVIEALKCLKEIGRASCRERV